MVICGDHIGLGFFPELGVSRLCGSSRGHQKICYCPDVLQPYGRSRTTVALVGTSGEEVFAVGISETSDERPMLTS